MHTPSETALAKKLETFFKNLSNHLCGHSCRLSSKSFKPSGLSGKKLESHLYFVLHCFLGNNGVATQSICDIFYYVETEAFLLSNK